MTHVFVLCDSLNLLGTSSNTASLPTPQPSANSYWFQWYLLPVPVVELPIPIELK